MKYTIFVIGVGIFLLTSCSARDEFLEIDKALAEASLMQKVNVEPLPSFPAQSNYDYQSQAKRNPFHIIDKDLDLTASKKTQVTEPDLMRVKESLELFDLP